MHLELYYLSSEQQEAVFGVGTANAFSALVGFKES